MQTGERYRAISENFPGLSIPLEMLGSGKPKILEWERKKPPYGAIGVLRFAAGTLDSPTGPEELESSAIVDVATNTVLGIELHRKGNKLANWNWEDGRLVVASAEGLAGEFVFRQTASAREPATQTATVAPDRPRRASQSSQDDNGGNRDRDREATRASSKPSQPAWVPWAQQAPSGGGSQREAPRPKKQKSIFDMIFGN